MYAAPAACSGAGWVSRNVQHSVPRMTMTIRLSRIMAAVRSEFTRSLVRLSRPQVIRT